MDSLEDARLESARLKIGYFANLTERFPFNMDFRLCSSPESAYFWKLEREAMEIPEELWFDTLEAAGFIEEVHSERIAQIWRRVVECQHKWIEACGHIMQKWREAPATDDPTAHRILATSPLLIRDEFHSAILAMISSATLGPEEIDFDSTIPVPLNALAFPERDIVSIWKKEDKDARKSYYEADKNYFVALRAYYEMLLERSPKANKKKLADKVPHDKRELLDRPPVLGERFPEQLRESLVVRLRKVRFIDADHQAESIGKTEHHQQGKKRLRQSEAIPYVNHVIDVIRTLVAHVLSYEFTKFPIGVNPVEVAFAGALHDVPEDYRNVSLNQLVDDLLWTRADKIDSTLLGFISSGFGVPQETFIDFCIYLAKKDTRKALKKVLSLLDKNSDFFSTLSQNQKERIARANVFGTAISQEYLDDNSMQIGTPVVAPMASDIDTPPRRRKKKPSIIDSIPAEEIQPESEASKLFSDLRDAKTERIILGIHGVDQDVRRLVLITKLADRLNNMRTLEQKSMEKRRAILRATVRLIAWCELDYPETEEGRNFPLNSLLPELIKVTREQFKKYLIELVPRNRRARRNFRRRRKSAAVHSLEIFERERFEDEHCAHILDTLATECPQCELPEEVRNVFEEYAAAAPQRKREQKQWRYRKPRKGVA